MNSLLDWCIRQIRTSSAIHRLYDRAGMQLTTVPMVEFCPKATIGQVEGHIIESWWLFAEEDGRRGLVLDKPLGPAIDLKCSHGTLLAEGWYRNDQLHRLTGPAEIYFGTDRTLLFWHIHGQPLPYFEMFAPKGEQGVADYIGLYPDLAGLILEYVKENLPCSKLISAIEAAALLADQND